MCCDRVTRDEDTIDGFPDKETVSDGRLDYILTRLRRELSFIECDALHCAFSLTLKFKI